jgi:hypothetical protein
MPNGMNDLKVCNRKLTTLKRLNDIRYIIYNVQIH